jgi:NAD-dependent deacetylase
VKPAVVFFNEGAPLYRRMHKALNALDFDDVLLVMGTSGAVVPIGVWAATLPATTVLSNLKSDDRLSMPGAPVCEDRQFNHVLHGRAAERAAEIEALVDHLMTKDPDDEI